jgi:hypothetical protein
MAKEKIIHDELGFDSWEEIHFYWWCKALIDSGYIESVKIEPPSFLLTEPLVVEYFKPMKKVSDKMIPEELMKGNIYTCDALITWTDKAFDVFFMPIASKKRKKKGAVLQFMLANHSDKLGWYSYVEVKPTFDQNNMTRLAKNNIKHVYSKYGMFINLVVPEKLFNKTFTPKRFLSHNKKAGKRKIKHKNIISLKTFIDNSSLDS